MKNINKILASILFIEGVYLLYTFLIKVPKILSTFDPSNMIVVYTLIIYIATIVFFILAGLGVWRYKKYGIVCGVIAVLLPQALRLIIGNSNIPFEYNYTILTINMLIIVYIIFFRKKI